jgi:hypothetical protein
MAVMQALLMNRGYAGAPQNSIQWRQCNLEVGRYMFRAYWGQLQLSDCERRSRNDLGTVAHTTVLGGLS